MHTYCNLPSPPSTPLDFELDLHGQCLANLPMHSSRSTGLGIHIADMVLPASEEDSLNGTLSWNCLPASPMSIMTSGQGDHHGHQESGSGHHTFAPTWTTLSTCPPVSTTAMDVQLNDRITPHGLPVTSYRQGLTTDFMAYLPIYAINMPPESHHITDTPLLSEPQDFDPRSSMSSEDPTSYTDESISPPPTSSDIVWQLQTLAPSISMDLPARTRDLKRRGIVNVPRKRQTRQRLQTGESCFLCQICGQSFPRAYNRRQHMQTHNSDRKRPFHCEIEGCDAKPFVRAGDLKRHKDTVHKLGKAFECAHCSFSTPRPDTLRR
jgi:hypothetical protein